MEVPDVWFMLHILTARHTIIDTWHALTHTAIDMSNGTMVTNNFAHFELLTSDPVWLCAGPTFVWTPAQARQDIMDHTAHS